MDWHKIRQGACVVWLGWAAIMLFYMGCHDRGFDATLDGVLSVLNLWFAADIIDDHNARVRAQAYLKHLS